MQNAKTVPRTDIKRYVRALARRFAPRRVILFGSYATGNPTADSDVDLLVVMDGVSDPVRQALWIRRQIPRAFPLDILVKSSVEIKERMAMKDMFLTSILREGRVLYEEKCWRVGKKSRW